MRSEVLPTTRRRQESQLGSPPYITYWPLGQRVAAMGWSRALRSALHTDAWQTGTKETEVARTTAH